MITAGRAQRAKIISRSEEVILFGVPLSAAAALPRL
jgi:hypothetical protein